VYDTLIGFNHTIEAQDQIQATTTYTFASWSMGEHNNMESSFQAPAQSYTATYIAHPFCCHKDSLRVNFTKARDKRKR